MQFKKWVPMAQRSTGLKDKWNLTISIHDLFAWQWCKLLQRTREREAMSSPSICNYPLYPLVSRWRWNYDQQRVVLVRLRKRLTRVQNPWLFFIRLQILRRLSRVRCWWCWWISIKQCDHTSCTVHLPLLYTSEVNSSMGFTPVVLKFKWSNMEMSPCLFRDDDTTHEIKLPGPEAKLF